MIQEGRAFHERVVDRIIEQLREGVAPWQQPWGAARPGQLPLNPTSGNRYRGANALQLMCQQRADPRWLTYRQAQTLGAHVRKGERGTPIQYWKFAETRPVRDASGRVTRVESGATVTQEVRLARPRVFCAVVFNAEQVEGLPGLVAVEPSWDPLARAEDLLKRSGATIEHGAHNRAFYRRGTDSIHLLARQQFRDGSGYYATALHELGHWTGHESRLARDLSHPFGSIGYAREELRAEIASLILGHELGVGHDPRAHASYVGAWIQVLQNDPLELFRAAADAERIHSYVMSRGLQQEQLGSELGNGISDGAIQLKGRADAQEQGIMASPRVAKPVQQITRRQTERHYLAVPYAERREAAAAGAAWDREAKCWYAKPGADPQTLARWEPSPRTEHAPPLDARAEFAGVLERIGCEVDGDHPIMDGRPHRIRTGGDKGRERAGFYVGHLDGVPAGYCKNNRTGEDTSWRAVGYLCTPEERAEARARSLAQQQERAKLRQKLHQETATKLARRMNDLVPLSAATPYLQAKGVAPTEGVVTDREGLTTYVPAVDVEGRLWSIQYIQADGTKRFAKNSHKEGCFHPVGGIERLASAEVLVIAEGYATATTLAAVLGQPTVAAFDAGNLLPVATALRERYPLKPIVIAADDDRRLELEKGINPGLSKARAAADAIGGVVVSPVFGPGELEAGMTDFNDLAQSDGRAAVGRQVQPVVYRALEAGRHQDRRVVRGRGRENSGAGRTTAGRT